MKKLLFVYFFAAITAFAFEGRSQDFGLLAAYRTDSADARPGFAIGSRANWSAGMLGFLPMVGDLQLRGGFLYSQRQYGYSNTAGSDLGRFDFTYFDVPIGIKYKIGDYGGPFVGLVLPLNVSKACPNAAPGGSGCNDVSGAPLGYQIGASFKFAPQLGVELYYEALGTRLADGVENAKAVVAGLLITFD